MPLLLVGEYLGDVGFERDTRPQARKVPGIDDVGSFRGMAEHQRGNRRHLLFRAADKDVIQPANQMAKRIPYLLI